MLDRDLLANTLLLRASRVYVSLSVGMNDLNHRLELCAGQSSAGPYNHANVRVMPICFATSRNGSDKWIAAPSGNNGYTSRCAIEFVRDSNLQYNNRKGAVVQLRQAGGQMVEAMSAVARHWADGYSPWSFSLSLERSRRLSAPSNRSVLDCNYAHPPLWSRRFAASACH